MCMCLCRVVALKCMKWIIHIIKWYNRLKYTGGFVWMQWCPMTLMRLMSAPLEFPRCPQTGASFHCLPVFCGDSGGALFCRQTETILWPLCVCPAHSECSAAFPAAGHSSYFSSRPDVAVIYCRSSSAVGSSNGREPKSASEKYDQPAELRLNVDSNQLQLLMSQSKGFFLIYFRPLCRFISAGFWCEGCAERDGSPLASPFKLTICLGFFFLWLAWWFMLRTCAVWRRRKSWAETTAAAELEVTSQQVQVVQCSGHTWISRSSINTPPPPSINSDAACV